MDNVGATNTKSGDYHFFYISSITCWPFTYGILNMVEFVLFYHPKIFAIS